MGNTRNRTMITDLSCLKCNDLGDPANLKQSEISTKFKTNLYIKSEQELSSCDMRLIESPYGA